MSLRANFNGQKFQKVKLVVHQKKFQKVKIYVVTKGIMEKKVQKNPGSMPAPGPTLFH